MTKLDYINWYKIHEASRTSHCFRLLTWAGFWQLCCCVFTKWNRNLSSRSSSIKIKTSFYSLVRQSVMLKRKRSLSWIRSQDRLLSLGGEYETRPFFLLFWEFTLNHTDLRSIWFLLPPYVNFCDYGIRSKLNKISRQFGVFWLPFDPSILNSVFIPEKSPPKKGWEANEIAFWR